jgi:hypothetical protein
MTDKVNDKVRDEVEAFSNENCCDKWRSFSRAYRNSGH